MSLPYSVAGNVVTDPSVLTGEQRDTAAGGKTTNADIAISAPKHGEASLFNFLIYGLPFVPRTYVDRFLIAGNVDLIEVG